jgi:predicted RecB family nuclease
VRLIGQADAVVRRPRQAEWCVVELKLGRGQPEADLGQACLYYTMLAASGDHVSQRGSLVLVSFTPRLKTRIFAPAELEHALPSLP